MFLLHHIQSPCTYQLPVAVYVSATSSSAESPTKTTLLEGGTGQLSKTRVVCGSDSLSELSGYYGG